MISNHLLFKVLFIARKRVFRGIQVPVNVLIAVQLSYTYLKKSCAISLQLASGEVFGQDQPIALNLLGSDRSKEALEGTRAAYRRESLTSVLDLKCHHARFLLRFRSCKVEIVCPSVGGPGWFL